MRLSIKAKVTLWYTGLVVLLLGLMLVYIFYSSDRMILGRARETVIEAVSDAAEKAEVENGELKTKDIEFYVNGVSIFIYDKEGYLLAPSSGTGMNVSAILEPNKMKTVDDGGEKWLVYDVYTSIDGVNLWFRGVKLISTVTGTLDTVMMIALVAVPFIILIAALGGYRITKRAFQPVQHMIDTVEEINGGDDLSMRLNAKGADEVANLGKTFDQMLDRLQVSFEKEKQFSSDVSHELRTPTAIMISACEYALEEAKTDTEIRESIQVILRQAKKMSVLISQLLMMVRADHGKLKLELEYVNVSELCEVIVEEMQMTAEKENVQLKSEIEPNIFLGVDQTLIMRLVTNLLSNGIKYNRENGWVKLKLSTNEGICLLEVMDSGIGIASEHLERIWDRFYRADQARGGTKGGTGLGLSMVQVIAELHRGTVAVSSTEGVGSKFTVQLPTS